jgi:uncharacterized protein (DUF433 family)
MRARHIVTASRICRHGEPTFSGTKILAADVLEQVAERLSSEEIIAEWRGSITKEAISEAIALSKSGNFC